MRGRAISGRFVTGTTFLLVLTNAQAGNESKLAIYGQHFAMVPREPSKGRAKLRRIVTTDLNPGCTQVVPETMGCLSETAHPIVKSGVHELPPAPLRSMRPQTSLRWNLRG